MSSPTDKSIKTVVVGMSGGVDSAVSALLLKEQGYHVIGLYMRNWEESDENGVCKSKEDYEDVVRVSETIGIPYYSVNFTKEYQDNVFAQFLKDYDSGLTPNPDILCNREIKFKVLFEKALSLGADFLATGHYCGISESKGEFFLLKGEDSSKDQSYFLHAIDGKVLSRVLFPLGKMSKKEVRRIAEEKGLANAKKKDSTGICFIGKRKFREFLSQYLAIRKGNIETLSGKVLGQHQGIAYYTLGQRQGLGIGGEGDAWFVVGKDVTRNVLIVDQGNDSRALYADELFAKEATWIKGEEPEFPLKASSKIRYRQSDEACEVVKLMDGTLHIKFARPQRAITPGQSIVFYEGNKCLGGAQIIGSSPNYYEMGKSLPDTISFKKAV